MCRVKKRGGEQKEQKEKNHETTDSHVYRDVFNGKPTIAIVQKADKDLDNEVKYEFCGPIGVSFIMLGSILFMYYFYACLLFNGGQLYTLNEFTVILPILKEHVLPTLESVIVYFGFVSFQALLAVTMPGPIIQGLPVISLGGKRLDYLCNGLAS